MTAITSRRRAPRLLLLIVAGLAAACDGGPKGPGTRDGVVEGPANLGAVVLEVTGSGIQGFKGRGDTRAYGTVVSAAEGRHRVVLVDAAGGLIEFGITVEDLGAEPPLVTVLVAAGSDNQAQLSTGVVVRLDR